MPTKNEEQHDVWTLDRVRKEFVNNRTALANQINELLRERGIVIPQAIARLCAALPLILDDESNRLSALVRELLSKLAERLPLLDDRLRQHDQRIVRTCQQDERCRRLVKVEGVDPLAATAVVAAYR
jgi:transposase